MSPQGHAHGFFTAVLNKGKQMVFSQVSKALPLGHADGLELSVRSYPPGHVDGLKLRPVFNSAFNHFPELADGLELSVQGPPPGVDCSS